MLEAQVVAILLLFSSCMDYLKQTPQIVVGGNPQSPFSWAVDWLRRLAGRAFSSLPYKIATFAVVLGLAGAGIVAAKVIRAQFPHQDGKASTGTTQQTKPDGKQAGGAEQATPSQASSTPAVGGPTSPATGQGGKPKAGTGGGTIPTGSTSAGGSSGSGGGGGSSGGTSTTACALPKYPTTSCTGVPSNTTLTTVSGNVTLSTPGQVLDAKLVTGDVIVSADNVIIKNSEVHGTVRNINTKSFTVQDTLIGPVSGCNSYVGVGFENYTARRVQIRNFGDGFRVSGDNILIEDSYVKLCSNPGDHSDGIQGYFGGVNVTINHNTIDQRGITDVTSPIFFADDSQSATITNNLLMGGGYTLRIHDDFTPDHGPWIITGNRLVDNAWNFGPISNSNTECATTTWSDNRLVTIDSGYNITSLGAIVGCN
jgi:hypothetical protein